MAFPSAQNSNKPQNIAPSAYMNVYVKDSTGESHKLGAIALRTDDPVMASIVEQCKADPDFLPTLEVDIKAFTPKDQRPAVKIV